MPASMPWARCGRPVHVSRCSRADTSVIHDHVMESLVEVGRPERKLVAGNCLLDSRLPAGGPLGAERGIAHHKWSITELLAESRGLERPAYRCADSGMRWELIGCARPIGEEGPEGAVVVHPSIHIQREPGGEIENTLGVIAEGGAAAIERCVRRGGDAAEVGGGLP